MPLDPARVVAAMRQGYGAVCATCEHFWQARDAKQNDCGKPCGGPIGGSDFPHYKGPLPDLLTWCFACAEASDYGIRMDGSTRLVGVCKTHLRLLDTLRLKGQPTRYTLLRSGVYVPLEAVQEPSKPTLVQAIIQAELDWAEEDAKAAEAAE
jgi:hypothetical protein